MNLSGAAFVIVLMIAGCGKEEKAVAQLNNPVTIKYTESSADFPNPERGFYRYSHSKASNVSPLTLNQLNKWKGEVQAEGGNYAVFSTLIFRYYEMDIFKSEALSPAFINSINQDFAIARQAGFKLIPRFTYTLAQNAGNCPEDFICPPYGDAPKNIVLLHISQLKQVLHDNADVIATVQMGFIGVWGEQYYTDYFGDASQNTTLQKLQDNNWHSLDVPGVWEGQEPGNIDGLIWVRKAFDIKTADAGKAAVLELAMIDDRDDTYVNGTLVGSNQSYNTPRKYEIPAGLLKAGRNVIAVKITDTGGGGGVYGDAANVKLTIGNTVLPLAGKWLYRIEEVGTSQSQIGPNNYPTLLFNAMLNPLIPYTIKGAIWYQGETNTGRAYEYRKSFPLMINDWRQRWK
ncbi:MAG: DUF4874 domain-containing protein, partial [Chitinophagaceae bacterium]